MVDSPSCSDDLIYSDSEMRQKVRDAFAEAAEMMYVADPASNNRLRCVACGDYKPHHYDRFDNGRGGGTCPVAQLEARAKGE